MAVYEFRLFSDGTLIAVHSAECKSDEGARERAQAYLNACSAFDTIVVRCGNRFEKRVQARPSHDPQTGESFWLM